MDVDHMTSGVCYFLCGRVRKYAGCLAIALHTIRKNYSGDIAILLGEDVAPDTLPPGILTEPWQRVPLADVKRHRAYVSKSALWRYAPFDNCVLLDCDTVCTGPIDKLFGHPFTVVRFSNWVTTGGIISGRLRQWEKIPEAAELLPKCLANPLPHVNTGILAWQRDSPILPEWERLSIAGFGCSFTDEYSCQLLITGRDDVRILDDRFNCSPKFGIYRDAAVLWHYHGRQYVRHKASAAQYRPHLLAALAENYAGIADWLETIDPALWELAQ